MLIYMGSGTALATSYRNRRIQALVECSRACGQAYRHCLDDVGSGQTSLARIALAALGCQEFCDLTASLMARGSEMARLTLSGCAEACRQCAEGCERDDADAILRDCGLRCRDCEQICRTLAGLEEEND